MPKTEKLDIRNIIEVDKIKKLLREHPDLLAMFEVLTIIINNRLNKEKVEVFINEIEEELKSPDLSDHSSDED
tara:strand:- start:580 stop:798 length:219 start_codon:yes stop_codon:yes gene_type:complete